MRWLFKRKPKPEKVLKKPLKWYKPDGSFRERSDYVSWANATLTSEEGTALQAYLFAAVPQSIFYRGDKVDLHQASLEYMRLAGYMECLSRLQDAAHMLPVAPPEIEADYDQTPPGQEQEL